MVILPAAGRQPALTDYRGWRLAHIAGWLRLRPSDYLGADKRWLTVHRGGLLVWVHVASAAEVAIYAEEAAARPDGLGNEIYARIVMSLRGYYKNIFHETKASWPRARAGLDQMRQRYPRSLDVINETALLAVMANDHALAKEMFDKLGDQYFSDVWEKPEYFVRSRKWAQGG